jgi:hypothetical protein
MRKVFCFLLLVVFSCSAGAQSSTQWQQMYGGPGVEVGYSVKSCLGQGYIVAGSSSSLGPSDGYVVRTDSMGVVMWEHFYGGVNVDIIRSIKLLPDSGFIMAGFTNSFGNGGYDCWVLRIDKNGDTLWTRTIGTTNWDFVYDVALTYDSAFVCAGGTYGAGNGNEDLLFFKLDRDGDLEWIRTFGGAEEDEARGVIETSDSLLAACGYTFSFGDTLGDSWELRLDPVNGDTIWTRFGLHRTGADKALGIAAGNGRFGIVGQYTTSTGDQNAYVHVMMNDSVTQLNLTAGISGYEYYSGIVFLTTSYNFATFGSTENDGAGNGDFFMFHDVNYLAYTYGTVDHEEGYSIDTAPYKGYIVCGSTDGYGSLVSNMYLVKIDSIGASTQVLDVREAPGETAKTSVRPNPAAEYVQLTIDALNPLDGNLSLTIFDVAGNVVMTVPSSEWIRLGENSSTCTFGVSALPAGFYQFSVSDQSGISSAGRFVVTH